MDELIKNAHARNKMKRSNLLAGQNYPTKLALSPHKFVNSLFTKTLLSIILVLICAIYINLSDNNYLNFKNHVFNNTLLFTKINNLYSKYFGNIIPSQVAPSTPVFGQKIEYTKIEELNGSYKVSLNSRLINSLNSGIIVFIGEKPDLGPTIIVQGVDGTDIWYSNITVQNLSLYDYIEENTILGEASADNITLTFIKDGQHISYENYLN